MRTHHFRGLRWLPALAIAMTGLGVPSAVAAPAQDAPAARSPRAMPVAFTPNVGQAAPGVRYLGAVPGAGIAFTDTGVTLGLSRKGDDAKSVTLRFEGANPHPRVTGADRAPGVVNDFHGSDASRWRTGMPGYGSVVYHDLWPGIDGIFSAKNGTLKYSFTVDPGANADRVRLAYDGASGLKVGRRGDLAITAGRTVLHDQAPVSFEAGGRRVATRYRLLGGTRFGFALTGHTAAAPLTIDPGLDFSTFLGSTDGAATSTFSVDNDADGNVYVFGQTASPAFPTTPGAYQRERHGDVDLVVTKFDPTGTRLIYSTYVGGSGVEGLSRGEAGGDGAVYVAAQSRSADFPTTAGAFRSKPFPAVAHTVAFKLGPDGSRLVYGTYLGPDMAPSDVRVGADGSMTMSANTSSDYAPTTPDAFQTEYPGGDNAGYVMRLNPAGSKLVYGTYVGAPITDQRATRAFANCWAYGIDVDAAGATYATGECTGDFPTTPGTAEPTGTGLNGLLVKLTPEGKLGYGTYVGDAVRPQIVRSDDVAVDKNGHAFVVSDAPPGAMPTTPDAYASRCASTAEVPSCATITEFDPSGKVVYSSYFGATGPEQTGPMGVATDDEGRLYVVGVTAPGLPTTPDAFASEPGTFERPFFLSVFHRNTLLYSTYFGGTGSACVGVLCGFVVGLIQIAPDVRDGQVYLGGTTAAPDFPVTQGTFQSTYPGGVNAPWAAKLTLPILGR